MSKATPKRWRRWIVVCRGKIEVIRETEKEAKDAFWSSRDYEVIEVELVEVKK